MPLPSLQKRHHALPATALPSGQPSCRRADFLILVQHKLLRDLQHEAWLSEPGHRLLFKLLNAQTIEIPD